MPDYRRTRWACYTAYFTMASSFALPPLLFVTLRQMYGISYTLLGTLVLINFCTQLAVDLIFTFFGKRFRVSRVVQIMPLITTAGLLLYALIPSLFPDFAYGGLVMGTVVFSMASGFSEVLLSPTIAAMPSEHPQRDMSLLHSLFAFGFLTTVGISSVFFKLFGNENWMYLTALLALLPVISAVLFAGAPMPPMGMGAPDRAGKMSGNRIKGLALCVAVLFFGSCAENAMSNWISGFMERNLHMDKALGDLLGPAMFAVLLGLTRIGYARFGKNISRMLLLSMAGSALCYLVAGFSSALLPAMLACILNGMFASMLWPGALILMEEKLPDMGVTAFALMAAGGDLGASLAPQLQGAIIDSVSAGALAQRLSVSLALTPEQIGMKAGMLVSSLFPIIGTILLLFTLRYFHKNQK